MSDEDREQGGNGNRDPGSDQDEERNGDAEQSEDVPLSDLRRDIDRRRGGEPERSAEESATKPGEELGQESEAEHDEEPSAKGPLSNLREGVERRRRERQESPPEADEAFETASSEPMIDGEQVWEDLLASQEEASAGLAFGEAVEGETEDVRIIPDRLCHNCVYFGDPPDLHCEHEGTEIRRVVDHEHFEVVECPVVKNRSDLTGQ